MNLGQHSNPTAGTVYTNQRIAIQADLVFHWGLLTEHDNGVVGWMPLSQLDGKTLQIVREEITDSIFPAELREYVATLPKHGIDPQPQAPTEEGA